jgi:hypothetical protein
VPGVQRPGCSLRLLPLLTHAGFAILRRIALQQHAPGAAPPTVPHAAAPPPPAPSAGRLATGAEEEAESLRTQARKLALQVRQRDQEVATLLAMLPQGAAAGAAAAAAGAQARGEAAGDGAPRDSCGAGDQEDAPEEGGAEAAPGRQRPRPQQEQPKQPPPPQHELEAARSGGRGKVLSALILDVGLLADRNKAFEAFRASYQHNEARGRGKEEGGAGCASGGGPKPGAGAAGAGLRGEGGQQELLACRGWRNRRARRAAYNTTNPVSRNERAGARCTPPPPGNRGEQAAAQGKVRRGKGPGRRGERRQGAHRAAARCAGAAAHAALSGV